MDTKMTKVMWFEAIKGIVEASDYEDKAGALEFCDKQIALIESKAEKAKAKKAEKKAAGDELRATVESLLTEDYQTAEAITAAIGDEEITKAKVVARLTALVNAEVAEKEAIKGEDGRKVMNYRLKTAVAAE